MSGVTRGAVLDACRALDALLAFQQWYFRVPGVQVAVLHDDEVVYSAAHGVADLTTGEPLTPGHLFRIASHSKTFTATAVLQLVERGVLRLDDPIGRWVDALDRTSVGEVTVREALAHAGGVIRDGRDGDFWQLFRAFPDADELLRVATDDARVLARNERFKYSNIGYSLLGQVIEAATGSSYADHVMQHVVLPLGLDDTRPEYDASRAGEYATGHSARSYADVRVPIDHVDTRAMASATGFSSTAADVVRYVAAHFHGDARLLSDDSKRLMQKTEWDVEGTGTSYGLGFGIDVVGGRRVLGHGGGYPGHITRTFFDPVDRFAVSVCTNAIDGPALQMATAAVALVNLAAEGPGSTGDDLARFCGRFASLWGVFDVVDLGGRLYQLTPTLADPTSVRTELEVVDDRTLRIGATSGYGSRGELLEYQVADDGTVQSVRGGSGSTAVPIARLASAVASRDRITLGDRLGA